MGNPNATEEVRDGVIVTKPQESVVENTEPQKSVIENTEPQESDKNIESVDKPQAVNENPKDEVNEHNEIEEIQLNYMDLHSLLECMSTPSNSGLEGRMVVYIILWCRRNNIKYEFDDYGNIYLTKGELEEGEYYPCVTSHMDTVHKEHIPYVKAGVPLPLKIELTKDKEHKLSVQESGIGIGADDKGGIAICLSLFNHFDKLKACFFLEEETGCKGSKSLWKEWFEDVGYVIGYDSPELYRAAFACSGTKLFSYSFYEKYMKDVCDSWGLTKGHFHSEPITDVKEIREKVGVICMNFGNGGYNPHSPSEYCILEHMDAACGLGIDLINKIGLTRHYLKHRETWDKTGSYVKTNRGLYIPRNENDDALLATLSDRRSYTTTTYTTKTSVSMDEQLKMEVLKYMVHRYDKYIFNLKHDILGVVKNVCNKNNIDYSLFEEELKNLTQEEITF